MTTHNSAEAQHELFAAAEQAAASNLPLSEGEEIQRQEDGAIAVNLTTVTSPDSASQVMVGEMPWGEQISNVANYEKQGQYMAHIRTPEGENSQPIAYVMRDGKVVHRFKSENQEKAAAIITSLAAKRLGGRVVDHISKTDSKVD